MKNQNEIIVCAVAAVLALILVATFWFTKRPAVTVADPAPIPLGAVQPPAGSVVFANDLPGASSTNGGTSGFSGGAPGGRGGAPSMSSASAPGGAPSMSNATAPGGGGGGSPRGGGGGGASAARSD